MEFNIAIIMTEVKNALYNSEHSKSFTNKGIAHINKKYIFSYILFPPTCTAIFSIHHIKIFYSNKDFKKSCCKSALVWRKCDFKKYCWCAFGKKTQEI